MFWFVTIVAAVAATLVYHFAAAALRRRRIRTKRERIDERKRQDERNWSY